ncbi:Rha family transcriptional regulator [Psychrobacter sp. ASPA161_6]|uniref:Rha family transcriptional regulator n=1 Tax=Psychrobacter sp. ASPA161_6 TaxID=3160962 RepID=UPI003F80E65C
MLPLELVSIENEVPKTTSLVVAKFFGKRHANVIRDIERLDCSGDFMRLNFELVMESMTYVDSNGVHQNKTTKRADHYSMTKDGLIFLVMGFTGKQAAKLKEAYINEFNRMSEILNQRQNSLMYQYNKVSIAYDAATKNASDAGRALAMLGKQIKPDLQERLDKLEKQMQLVLNFGQEKADTTLEDESANLLIKGN